MIFPSGVGRRTTTKAAQEQTYDVVIVGSGISGAIIADQLAAGGKRVLILEAGPGDDRTLRGYEEYVQNFYETAEKDNQAPYPRNPNVPMPRSTDARKIRPGHPDSSAYLVQNGPFASDTTYTRVLGGTTMHWEAKTPRLLPEDFEMRSRFGQSQDWPLGYDKLEPYYRMAEREIGVSADVDDQKYLGVHFPSDYVYPMKAMPHSYLDRQVDEGIRGTEVEIDGQRIPLRVRSFPQGRNGIPHPDYKRYNDGQPFVPVGAVSTHQVEEGERCQGNTNCVPICPVQAKYSAAKTLAKALYSGQVDFLPRSVAHKVHVSSDTGRVEKIEIRHYEDPNDPHFKTCAVKGRLFVLATNAIENARLLLASDLPSSSGLVGRNLMDHAYLLSWALMPQVCGTMRGTIVTGGIVELRGGPFRRKQAAFSVDIHNDGWGWAVGSPYSDLTALVDDENKFGPALRREISDRITRQLLLAFMVEVLPSASNRVTVDPRYTDQLGNMRPVISYSIPEYTMRGVAFARRLARMLFQRLGAADHTDYDPEDYGYVTHEGEGYIIRGGNHLAGTHIMGTSKNESVVNSEQRSWDHENLYLVGGGSMPSIGTANVTLTIAALCYRSAEAMIKQLS
jgi:choline dehydrogenase-like flavoprotein